jgi:hypothetical protein
MMIKETFCRFHTATIGAIAKLLTHRQTIGKKEMTQNSSSKGEQEEEEEVLPE